MSAPVLPVRKIAEKLKRLNVNPATKAIEDLLGEVARQKAYIAHLEHRK